MFPLAHTQNSCGNQGYTVLIILFSSVEFAYATVSREKSGLKKTTCNELTM